MNHNSLRRASYEYWKRIFDVMTAAFLLAITAPLQLIVAAVIARTMGRPVLFHQKRPGRHGHPFILIKFRTMIRSDPSTDAVSDGDRLTDTGRFLRATSSRRTTNIMERPAW